MEGDFAEMETSEGQSAARDGLKAELTGKSPAEMRQQIIATPLWASTLYRSYNPMETFTTSAEKTTSPEPEILTHEERTRGRGAR